MPASSASAATVIGSPVMMFTRAGSDEDQPGMIYDETIPRTYRANERLVLGSAHLPPKFSIADSASFSSLHVGGVNVLFADGHVHFISEMIDAAVWAGLADARDGTPGSKF